MYWSASCIHFTVVCEDYVLTAICTLWISLALQNISGPPNPDDNDDAADDDDDEEWETATDDSGDGDGEGDGEGDGDGGNVEGMQSNIDVVADAEVVGGAGGGTNVTTEEEPAWFIRK